MPKGHVDPGETLEEAACREVWEETGLEVEVGAPLGETKYSFMENDTVHRKRVYWFYMKATGGKLQPEAEMFTEIKLLSEEELNLLTFEKDRKLAKAAFALYKQEKGRGQVDG